MFDITTPSMRDPSTLSIEIPELARKGLFVSLTLILASESVGWAKRTVELLKTIFLNCPIVSVPILKQLQTEVRIQPVTVIFLQGRILYFG